MNHGLILRLQRLKLFLVSSSDLIDELSAIATDVDKEIEDMGLLIEMMEGYAPEKNTEISTALKNVEVMTEDLHEMVKSLRVVTDKLTKRKDERSIQNENNASTNNQETTQINP